MAQANVAPAQRVRAPGAERVLRVATVAFAIAFVFHNADHIRRGTGGISGAVLALGVVGAVTAVLVVAAVAVRHPLAAFTAALVGFATAVGVCATHLLPHWSVFSDAFPGGDVDALSWAAVLTEVAGSLLLGVAGLNALRRRT
jgi:hypothetical protein